MIKLLIDTCVWLDLAKNSKWEKILSLLEEFVENNELSLIIPEIIIEEFNRNKERIIANAWKSLSSHFDIVKETLIKYGNEVNKSIILSELSDLNYKIPTLGEWVSTSIERIEKLFSQSEIIKLTDEIKLKATQRAIDKKAPFHLNKNSIWDSIIIESYYDFKIKNKSTELIFLTHNKDDFSVKHGNQKQHHEDFNDIFDWKKSKYFISLPEVLNLINAEFVNEIEIEKDWYFEPRKLSEILDIENELSKKIWYNRHQNRVYRIKIGKEKIIERKDFNIKTANTEIIKDIWEWAKKSAKDIEDKYGKENLYWDDFEWGMINWKLSAIRWMNGEDWDMLDT